MTNSKTPQEIYDASPSPAVDGRKPMNTAVQWEFDRDGNMYIFGKRLEVAKTIDLNLWQLLIAGATAAGVFLGGLAAFIDVFRQ